MGNEERLVYTAAPRLTFTFVRRALMFTFRRALRMCVFAPASDPSPRYLMLLSRERISMSVRMYGRLRDDKTGRDNCARD